MSPKINDNAQLLIDQIRNSDNEATVSDLLEVLEDEFGLTINAAGDVLKISRIRKVVEEADEDAEELAGKISGGAKVAANELAYGVLSAPVEGFKVLGNKMSTAHRERVRNHKMRKAARQAYKEAKQAEELAQLQEKATTAS